MVLITFGVLTISDTCSKDESLDKSGKELVSLIENTSPEVAKNFEGRVLYKEIVEDDQSKIIDVLTKWSDYFEVNVILTTGGTGFSPRDVTPEATKKVIKKDVPSFPVIMLTESFKITKMAILSRAVSGIRGKTLIINLPGSTKAVKECFSVIASAIPHAVDLILDNKSNVTTIHSQLSNQHDCCRHEKHSNISMKNVADRCRESPYPMISMEEALKMINSYSWSGEFELVDLWNARGRILANDIYSSCDLPPFRASIKDGYAVLASDSKGKRQVLGGIEAGRMPDGVKLSSGFCVRVNTGAPVPEGATAVVQVEDTKLIEKDDANEEKEIEILVDCKMGQDIREIGSDIKKGELVLTKFTQIRAAEVGILAACGSSTFKVTKLPSVGILSTGNELQLPGTALKPGHVYDSNKITLMMLLKEYGYESSDLGIAIDDENTMIRMITDALHRVDVIITSGSVSMGDRDMLKPILKEVFKAEIHFGRVNMKPGKPTTLATCQFNGKVKYFVCLPGNPVSATVTAHLFVTPLLNRLSGNYSKPTIVQAQTTVDYQLDSRPEYARIYLKWDEKSAIPQAFTTGNQISSKLLNCKSANALLMLPGASENCSVLKKGHQLPAMLLGYQSCEI